MTTVAAPLLRPANFCDAEAIARLSGQLGYASTAFETAHRLAEIGGNEEHAVFVAESNGVLLGWVHVLVSHLLLADKPAEIAGLVVDERHRSRGIGQLLIDRAEKWAAAQGCRSVRLRSNIIRDRAHAFYQRLGYSVTKSQKVFSKDFAE